MKKTLEEINTEVKDADYDDGVLFNPISINSTFPSLFLMSPDDENTLSNLKVYLQNRLAKRNEAVEKFNSRKFYFFILTIQNDKFS